MGGLKKKIFKDKIITNKRDLIENIIQAWHNTSVSRNRPKMNCQHCRSAYKMGLLEREDSLNIQIVFVLQLNLYYPKLINL